MSMQVRQLGQDIGAYAVVECSACQNKSASPLCFSPHSPLTHDHASYFFCRPHGHTIVGPTHDINSMWGTIALSCFGANTRIVQILCFSLCLSCELPRPHIHAVVCLGWGGAVGVTGCRAEGSVHKSSGSSLGAEKLPEEGWRERKLCSPVRTRPISIALSYFLLAFFLFLFPSISLRIQYYFSFLFPPPPDGSLSADGPRG